MQLKVIHLDQHVPVYEAAVNDLAECLKAKFGDVGTGGNTPKMHILAHVPELWKEFGCYREWQEEEEETEHKRSMKDPFRTSNKSTGVEKQMTTKVNENEQ